MAENKKTPATPPAVVKAKPTALDVQKAKFKISHSADNKRLLARQAENRKLRSQPSVQIGHVRLIGVSNVDMPKPRQ
jgi:hypothetical protein